MRTVPAATLRAATVVALMASAAGVVHLWAQPQRLTLAVVMTNDPAGNKIKVYNAQDGALLQTLETNGTGGAGNNAYGVRQFEGEVFAAVNYGSRSVALFRRDGDRLRFERVVNTTSSPVSIDFGNEHMYVAGSTSVDSFVMQGRNVAWLDGSANLSLSGGAPPPEGATSQVGVVDARHLLVTLKADPDPGTVDVVSLNDGAIANTAPAAVSGPAGSLAPFGFVVYPDRTALITLAHSSENSLFRDGAFVDVVDSSQTAPCWMTRAGKYVFVANTASRTLSRLVGSGSHVFTDSAVAAAIPTGNPTDLDAAGGILAAIDHGGGRSHLSLFTYNELGELVSGAAVIDLDVPDANGVAVIPPPQDRDLN
ncbi:MAG TPA: hypothetical protein VFV98_19715 [Vicinamibacterales bacterium]|nr:hypothetical protein [Vicinamibacterales bacterium]